MAAVAVRAAVITCSDSVAAGRHRDESGSLAVEALRSAGFALEDPVGVPDEVPAITAAIRTAIEAGARVVVTNGGTGLGPRDVTIVAVESMGAVPLPGIGEAIRAGSRVHQPRTDLSRSGGYRLAEALVVCLPGSPGGVADGMTVVGPLLRHAVAMIDGEGHAHHGPAGHGPDRAGAAERGPAADGAETAVLGKVEDGSATVAVDPAEGASATVVLDSAREGSPTVALDPARLGSVTVVVDTAGDDAATTVLAQAEAAPAPAAPDPLRDDSAAASTARSPRSVVGDAPIELAALLVEVTDARAGAVVAFEGRVRNSDQGRPVVALAYEAHPEAARVLSSLVAATASRPAVTAAAAAHRTGELAIGELAFAVVVSAPHRRQAIEAMAWLVDEAKAVLPIWKLQRFADGTTEWVNSP